MDPSTVVAAGPSNIPPPTITPKPTDKRNENNKKRRPKRKRIASEASASIAGEHPEAGETDSVHVGVEAEGWSAPWLEELGTTSYESKQQRLHDEIVAFFNYISPTPNETHARGMVIAQVSEVARRRFRDASVETFGSVAQNLYLPDGDTDLVIQTSEPFDDERKKSALFQLAAMMRNSRITRYVQVIHRARVPVISFETQPDLGSLKVDISFNATDGVKAVPILRDYFDKMPALRYLVLCVKSLLSRHKLNTASSSGLSSYGVILLAINFLQLNPLKRPAAYLEQPMENESLGILLTDFLDYYGNLFDYAESVVSVSQGKVLSKEEKGWDGLNNPESLCIECMLNPENDVGRPTSKIWKIRKVLKGAHSLLESYAFSDVPAAHNILGRILGISDATLEHRILLKDIVTSGRLSQALREVQSAATLYSNAPRRPQSSYQQYNPRYNSRPYPSSAGNDRPRNNLPPKPPPPRQPSGPPRQPSGSGYNLPPRPGPSPKSHYVAQGPSLAALRAAASASADASANPNTRANDKPGDAGSTANTHSNGNGRSAQGMRSPPRRRRKA
ncbi:Nucleotidyltransferase [Lentinus tigrinus ALCF2SS1-7]|uniref:polynucleotide adenylyltransferase n=1 Tax=Lentinus tigrinus ALCF2SS1-6 TaxID=1328759 RepID=A0A5C2SN43_9APHY|nr:Nucleotidyltransferase [Lentinus tigrinus ALCF2SS1-6]RPD82780.1 Nucleotidyltransferase [Lentinus tigrinus ALCF2SS1-7]